MKKTLLFLGILFMTGLGSAQELAIIKGLSWLNANQDEEGCWGTSTPSPFKDTCVVLDTLHCLGTTNTRAVSWIAKQDVEITDYLSRKIMVLAEAGSDTTNLVGTLTSYQNTDGGFGGYKDWASDILDTALSLQALKSANYSDTRVIEGALWYLLNNQNTDGGWGFTDGSNVYLTSLVLLVLNQYRKDYYLEEAITKATNWLITQQNQDGSLEHLFGKQR